MHPRVHGDATARSTRAQTCSSRHSEVRATRSITRRVIRNSTGGVAAFAVLNKKKASHTCVIFTATAIVAEQVLRIGAVLLSRDDRSIGGIFSDATTEWAPGWTIEGVLDAPGRTRRLGPLMDIFAHRLEILREPACALRVPSISFFFKITHPNRLGPERPIVFWKATSYASRTRPLWAYSVPVGRDRR